MFMRLSSTTGRFISSLFSLLDFFNNEFRMKYIRYVLQFSILPRGGGKNVQGESARTG